MMCLSGARYVVKARPKTSALPGRRPVLRASVARTPVSRTASARVPATRAPVRPPAAKPEPKRPLDKDVVSPPTASPASGGEGHYELDPLTARVLEEELQQIMIKVWQDLPDVGRSDVERVVVDKLRNEAGYQLRNVLGLNVTKRLLNTFNPLSVKVHFTTKPERKYLRLFLKKYNFVAFKRIARVVNTFAAQVRTIADYDQLCRHRDIYCGAAKITITPYYRFKQCPKNLKTIYSTHEEDKNAESNEAIEKAMEEEVEANITNLKDNPPSDSQMFEEDHTTINTTSVATESQDEEMKTKENETLNKPESIETTSNAADSQPIAQSKSQVKNNPTSVKPQEKAAPNRQAQNKSVEKTTPVKPQPVIETTEPKVEKKAEIAKPQAKVETSNVQIKVEAAKVQAKAEAAAKLVQAKVEHIKAPAKVDPPKVQAKVQPAKPQTKVEPTKPTPTNPNVATSNVINKPKNVVKTPIKNVSASNNTNKKVGNKPVKTNANDKKNNKKSFDEYDDYEELDDEDILALMSRGIVLDECSGSDDNS